MPKVQANKPRGRKLIESPYAKYEDTRMLACMRNNARLQQLGIPSLIKLLDASVASHENKTNKASNCEDSESEYHPQEDDTSEGESFDDRLVHEKDALQEFESTPASSTAKVRLNSKKGSNSSTKKTAHMAPGGIKALSGKRVLADQPTYRSTRSKKNLTPQDGDASRQGNVVSNPKGKVVSTPSVHQAGQVVETLDNHTQPIVEDVNQHNEGEGVPQPEDNNHMASDGIAQPDANTHMGNEADESAYQDGTDQPDVQTQIDNDSEGLQPVEEEEWERGLNMGKGLRRLTRARRAKLPIIIPEGRIRPVTPLIAAKYATECNIAVRSHIPIFPHWKDYKKQPGILQNFMGKVAAKFHMDINDPIVRNACTQMMKSAIRQQRHRLKRKYFSPYPLHAVTKTSPVTSMTNQQWNDLVESWKDPKKMETSEKNKANRSQVKFHQTTGSRSYAVHCENLGDKYKDTDPTALDLFKECHYSNKKKGYTNSVQSAITEMETRIPKNPEDGQQPNSVTNVVSEVLAEKSKNNKFLQNVGLQERRARSNASNLEAELAAEKRGNAELLEVVNTQREQMDALSKQVQEAEEARIRQEDEMRKKQAEMDAKLELLLRQIRQS